jgi:DNA-directed RNA polymerase subunit RPC12/RpoP
MYKCIACKRVMAKAEDKIRCSYCGQRVFIKLRPDVVTRVLAR